MKKLSKRSLNNLKGVDEKITLIIGMALARGKVDLTITEGIRTSERQQDLFKKGFSQLDGIMKKSKHQIGKAIDFIPYPFNGWNDIESFKKVGEELKLCADYLGIKNSYGGNWQNFKDYPHFQIDEV